jgi:hypothetical protein
MAALATFYLAVVFRLTQLVFVSMLLVLVGGLEPLLVGGYRQRSTELRYGELEARRAKSILGTVCLSQGTIEFRPRYVIRPMNISIQAQTVSRLRTGIQTTHWSQKSILTGHVYSNGQYVSGHLAEIECRHYLLPSHVTFKFRQPSELDQFCRFVKSGSS